MKDYRSLKIWQAAHQLTLAIYKTTVDFPREEMYGLTSQMRRCSASIGANIAEGCGRRGNREFLRFLQIASGSASELDYHLLLARDLGFLRDQNYRPIFSTLLDLRRMMSGLIRKIDTERSPAEAYSVVAAN